MTERPNTHDVRLVETCIRLKPSIERTLDGLIRHYECEYALVSFSGKMVSHVPCSASRNRVDAAHIRTAFPRNQFLSEKRFSAPSP